MLIHLKKLTAIILCFLLLTATLPFSNILTANALMFSGWDGDFKYTISDDYATLTGSKETLHGEVVVPTTINGYPVKVLEYTFCGNSSITKVTLPDTVTVIGIEAFSSCTGLTSVTIPQSVTTISNLAFAGCKVLTEIIMPDSVTTLLTEVFSGCSGLKNIKLSKNLTGIGRSVFQGCSSLEKLTIPEGMTFIGESTFSNCTSLKDIFLPNSIKRIGPSAFYNCSSIQNVFFNGTEKQWKEVTISDSNQYLKNATFYFCCSCGGEFEDLVTVSTATCTQNGVKYRICKECNTTEYYTSPAKGHKYGNWIKDVEPTCTDNGFEHRICSVCENIENRTISPVGHSYGNWITDIPATCTEIGIKHKVCSVCGENQYTDIPSFGHTDIKNGHCISCGEEFTTLESTHDYLSYTDKTWTISQDGATKINLTFCQDTYTETYYDFIYIYDGDYNFIGKYCGSDLASKTITVNGDTAIICLVSDSSENFHGFCVEISPVFTQTENGDIDGDGLVAAKDLVMMRNFLVTANTMDTAYDINDDGYTNVKDLVRLKTILVNKVK